MDLSTSIDHALAGRTLLSHPFYRRWEAGELREGELASYAAQYVHVERQLPGTLQVLVDALPDGEVRTALASNLADELSNPTSHVELFSTFADAVGATAVPATTATSELVELYADAPARSVGFAVGVLAAYEVQAAAIARSKADGLRRHYELSDSAVAFWDLHADLEADHAAWSMDAASSLDVDEVMAGVIASRDAWWAFLDDRELAAAHA
jgi:pyrroloquinoline-quinone synthase